MQARSTFTGRIAVLTLAAFCSWSLSAQAPAAPPLADQLKSQYTVVKLDRDGTGARVIGDGTVLTVQKAGILGVPPGNLTLAPSKYQDGVLHSPGAGARMFIGNDTRFFDVGERVYPTKVDVNVKGDKISIMIIECAAYNNTDLSYRASVVFQFPSGYLAKAELTQIVDVISQVLAPSSGTAQTQGGQLQQEQPQSQAEQPVQAQPLSVQLGQTVEEVQAALGQPLKTANLGSKLIYVYKDLKVTFVNGKVSDVQ